MQPRKRERPEFKYIDVIPNRHGVGVFTYFRRHGKRTALPGKMGSPDWVVAYAACLAGAPLPAGPGTPIARVKAGTIEAMWNAYTASAKYKNFKRKSNRDTAMKRIRELGLADLEVARITRNDLRPVIDGLAETKPGAARQLRDTFACIFAEAIDRDLVVANPLAGTPRPKLNPGGHFSWEEEHVEQFRQHHKLGTMPRLALEIFLHTALRCCDARKAGPATLRNGKITLIQQKLQHLGERARVTIPIHPNLRAAIDAMPVVGHKTWLVTKTGKEYDESALSLEFGAWCDEADLPTKCRAHGLRKACARRLIDAGVSVPHAAAITGHLDMRELLYYAEARDRVLGAERAMAAIS
jgi:integrase